MQNLFPRVNHQLRVADTIILNKIDQNRGNLNQIQNTLKTINPYATTIATTFCQVNLEAINQNPKLLPVALRQKNIHENFESCGRPEEIGFSVIKTARTIKRKNLLYFLKKKSSRVLRIKGIVRLTNQHMVAIQSSHGDTYVTPIAGATGPTEIIALGVNLDNKKFRDDFLQVADH